MTGRAVAVVVYCSAEETPACALAHDVGLAAAHRGVTVVYGGGLVGMMGALARGVRAGGGRLVGVIPRHMVDRELANPGCDELVVVDSMAERKTVMGRRADGHLTLPGGLGTLDELLECWTTGVLGEHDKPVALLDPIGHYQPLLRYLHHLAVLGYVRAASLDRLQLAGTVAQALDASTGAVVLPRWAASVTTITHGGLNGGGAGGCHPASTAAEHAARQQQGA